MHPPPSSDETLFAAALERPVGERAAFLDTACAGDAARRARIEGLLSAHDAAERDFMATAASGTPRLSEPAAGQMIGRYKLLQKLGEGGCGTVYMAEQEEPVRRRVALKVIKLGMDTKEVIARFSAEQQALALMDHPNIARVFDAGATESGRPFFVMELVRGIPITKFCDEQNLSTRARLELFTQVCHAVQHAHQKGIIHRDIKPSNILVTLHDSVPVPKVIDFGIAKATQGRLTDATLFTAFEQFIGTPAYMSPEQAEMSGLDIDTRSDIYSLGVLLYELLTGHPPFDPKTLVAAGLDEIRRIIREVEPPRMSTRLSTLNDLDRATIAKQRGILPGQLSTLLRGDLDWVVMRCLEKDRTRRYETANAVALDVLRHLHDEPVVARPPSAAYRASKLFRRHRIALSAAAVLMLVITLGGAISVWQAVRATRAEAVAEAQRQLAEQRLAAETIALAQAQSSQRIAESESLRSKEVARFMEDMLTAVRSSAARGRDTTLLRDILEDTALRIGRDLGSQPEVEATLRGILGRIYRSLGDHAKSLAMHEAQLALRRKHSTADDPQLALALEECAGAIIRQASAAVSVASERSIAGAESLLREALALRATRPAEWRDIANCTQSLAECLIRLGRFDEADRLVRGLIGIVDLSTPDLLAIAFVNYGALLDRAGRSADAERYFRDALQKLHEVPEAARTQPRLLSLENAIQINLASVVHGQGRYGESAQLARARLEVLRTRHGDSHASLLPALDQLSRSLHSLGQKTEAAAVDEAARVIRQKTLPTDRPLGVPPPAVSVAPGGNFAPESNRPSDLAAVSVAREQQGIRNEALRLASEANALSRSGKRPQAEPVFRAALAQWRKADPRDFFAEANALADIAGSLHSSKAAEAAELYREALGLLRAHGHGESLRAAVALSNLSGQLRTLKRSDEAIAAAREGLDVMRALAAVTPRHRTSLPSYLGTLADRLMDAGKLAEAEPFLREASQLHVELQSPAVRIHTAALKLAACLLLRGDLAQAGPLLRAGAEFLDAPHPEFTRLDTYGLETCLPQIANAWEKLGRADEAATWQRLLRVTLAQPATPPARTGRD